jgi:sugar phosphate isomerase/epimerase
LHLPVDLDLSALDAARRTEHLDRLRDLLSRLHTGVHRLGLSYVVLHPGGHLADYSEAEYGGRLEAARESLTSLLGHEIFDRVRLGLENTLSNQFGGRPRELQALLECGPPEKLGIVLDTCHAVFDYSPQDFMQLFPGRIIGFHLSDNDVTRSCDRHAPPLQLENSAIDWRLFCELHQRLELPRAAIAELGLPRGQTIEELLAAFHESASRLEALYAEQPRPGTGEARDAALTSDSDVCEKNL